MPVLFILNSAVRLIDPDNSEQLKWLQDQIPMEQAHSDTLSAKTFEPDLSKMPLYANADYADGDYIRWAQNEVSRAYPGTRLRYGIIDMVLEPKDNPEADPIVMPAALTTVLEYRGKKILGPLMAGLPGDMLTSKGEGYDPAKQNLSAPYNHIFNSKTQGQFLADMIEHFLDAGKAHNQGKPRYNAVIIATPDLGAPDVTKRGSYRAFNGMDPASGQTLHPPRPRMQPENFTEGDFNFYAFSDDPSLRSALADTQAREMLNFVRSLRQRYAQEQYLERPAKRLEPKHAAGFLSEILSHTHRHSSGDKER